MEEEEERVHFEEEEVTTIHRKTIRTQSTTRRKKHRDAKTNAGKTDIQLSPYILGAKNRDAYKPGTPEAARKPDRVQKLVQDTLNEYKGSELPQKSSNRIFLGAFDSDEEENDDIEDIDVAYNKTEISKLRVWSFQKSGRRGLDRFRKIVDFVILAQNVFTCRRTVNLNRRDSILFFLDRQSTADPGGGESEPKFDLSAFKSLGQKTKMASVKTCLEIPPSERTDGQINHMMHTMRAFKKFSNYPQAIQTGLCKKGWYAKFEASKVIVKEGNKAEFYYLILSGIAVYRDIAVSVDEMHNTRNELVASYLKPGDTLGGHHRHTPSLPPQPPRMMVVTTEFNPSTCTCGCGSHYRMEREVVWSNKDAKIKEESEMIQDERNVTTEMEYDKSSQVEEDSVEESEGADENDEEWKSDLYDMARRELNVTSAEKSIYDDACGSSNGELMVEKKPETRLVYNITDVGIEWNSHKNVPRIGKPVKPERDNIDVPDVKVSYLDGCNEECGSSFGILKVYCNSEIHVAWKEDSESDSH